MKLTSSTSCIPNKSITTTEDREKKGEMECEKEGMVCEERMDDREEESDTTEAQSRLPRNRRK
jgi:hypothetical protein